MDNNIRVVIEVDELWPFYSLPEVSTSLKGGRVVSVDQAFIDRYNRIMGEFFDLQAQLAGLYKITKGE